MSVTAIIPAFNEFESIPHVIKPLREAGNIDQIVVVSDGSTDSTAQVARDLGVTVLELTENIGKARAMAAGLKATDSEIVVFVDADILNLTSEMLEELVQPVVDGTLHMNVGVRNHGFVFNKIQRSKGPLLSGNRCMNRGVFESVPDKFMDGFKIETALNWVCRSRNLKYSTILLPGIFHIAKERKRGYIAGFVGRIRMYFDVLVAYLELTYGSKFSGTALPAEERVG